MNQIATYGNVAAERALLKAFQSEMSKMALTSIKEIYVSGGPNSYTIIRVGQSAEDVETGDEPTVYGSFLSALRRAGYQVTAIGIEVLKGRLLEVHADRVR